VRPDLNLSDYPRLKKEERKNRDILIKWHQCQRSWCMHTKRLLQLPFNTQFQCTINQSSLKPTEHFIKMKSSRRLCGDWTEREKLFLLKIDWSLRCYCYLKFAIYILR
jgi:hypothetical protein